MDLTKPDVIRQCWEVFFGGPLTFCDGLIRFCGDKQPQGAFSCGNAPFGGGEKPGSGSNYLSLLIHVGLQAGCSMVTCSGLGSIVLWKRLPRTRVFISRLEFNWSGP